jgi:hypothetical protein
MTIVVTRRIFLAPDPLSSLFSAQAMPTRKLTPTAATRLGPRESMLPRLGALLAIVLSVGCSGGASDTFNGPATLKIKAVSATSFTGKMGDLVSVAIDVDALDDPSPPFGTKVTFVASDAGLPFSRIIALPPDGTAQATWRFGPVEKVQTLTATVDGAPPLVFQANVAGNPWTVTTVGTTRSAARFADEGSISTVGGDPWASTMFGSPPRLVISCTAGNVGVALAHPRMAANGNWVAYSFGDSDFYTEHTWSQLTPLSDSLFHPGPNTASGTLAKQIAVSSAFRLVYRQYFPNGNFTAEVAPTFGVAGLPQVISQVMTNCPAGR